MDSDNVRYMTMALELARKGWGRVSPNPMVGAVVVKNDVVVGQGFHEALGGAHAEVNAIDEAGEAARDATLYVTLEPCNHFGRTPPCTQKILEAGIRRVVVAMADPNPDVTGGGNDFLASKGVTVETGVLEAEARRLNESFIKFVRTKEPFVILKCAATLDGQIATRTGDSKWVTGEAARAYVHWLRHGVDGILVGGNTVRLDDPSLTARLPEGRGKDPVRIVLDSRLSIPETAKVLHQNSGAPTILVTGNNVSEEKKERFRKMGVKVIRAPLRGGFINLRVLMGRLGYIGISSLLIEGGGRVMASAIKSGIVDKVIFFYAPKVLGGNDGIPMFRGKGPQLIRQAIPVRGVEVRRFGDDLMVEGYIDKTPA